MTGLRVWLHPSSRTKMRPVIGDQWPVKSFLSAGHWPLATDHLLLDSSPLRRTASVVRDGRHIANRPHFNARRGQSSHRRLAAGTGTAHADVHTAYSMIARHAGSVRRRLLRGERRALARSAKAQRSRTLPRQNVAVHVSDGHDRVVKGCLHIAQSMRNVLALLLLERFLLAFFLRCGSAARCCWFRHS